MRWAVVGSRDYAHLNFVAHFVETFAVQPVPLAAQILPRRLPTIVSGGARGVDETAVEAAICSGLETKVFPADWSKGPSAGFTRNELIVDYSDFVVAFWDGVSRGTLDTIRRAHEAGKQLIVYWGLKHLPTPKGALPQVLMAR